MTRIRLVAINGDLYFPKGGHFNAFEQDQLPQRREETEAILMYQYPAGDYDTLPWPLESKLRSPGKLRFHLAAALYDERECNEFFPTDAEIELPDGTLFDFDTIVAEYDHGPDLQGEW